ncbi:MAG: sigma-70 family RNA polymerase sigma factor [Oleibacter sp.]|nr:sigma-70 family RNA polymerase sigma factor [Thalassolituus sp.]
MPIGGLSDAQYQQLHDDMLRFARLQLSDDEAAADAVQEAMVGALRNAQSFKSEASFKTWVFAILKNKIADSLRKRYRDPLYQADTENDCKKCESSDDQWFNDKDHWRSKTKPRRWGDTEQLTDNEQFWRVFDACLNDLPGDQARVFMMREFVELEAGEICESLALSTSNLHVLLHRARLRLRACLATSWFAENPSVY